MKKITLLFLFLFALGEMNAQIWTINTCSSSTSGTNLYGPMYSSSLANATSRAAHIYPASQLAGISGETLNALYLNRTTTTGSMLGTPNLKIYIKEVAVNDWGSVAVDWATVTTGATLVYDSNPATIVGSTNGWKSFPFTNNFIYSGTQNLAVFFEYINTTASSSISWNYEFTAPCVDIANSNTTKYFYNSTGTLTASLASTNYRRPVLGFDFNVSCNAPNNLVSSNLGTNSTTIAWTENAIQPQNGYEYYNSTSSTAPTSTQTPSGSVATGVTLASLSGLTSATTYYFWVRGNCGTNDKSVWKGPISYTTLCDPIAAFVENFDSWPTGSTAGLPICWSKLGDGISYLTTASADPMSAPNRLYSSITATTNLYVLLPPVSNLQANTHRLKFKVYCSTANKVLSVGYFTTPGDINTYVEIVPVQMPSTNLASTGEFTIIPTSIPAGVSQLVLKPVAGSSTTFYIDDVKWELNSSCVEPSGLTASSITNNSASLGWTNGGAETVWDIQYGLTNFALGSGTMVNGVTVKPHTINGLMANTSYQFYVRGVCTGSINSSWSGPFTFNTLCNDATDFSESFDSYPTGSANPLGDCWAKGGNGSVYLTTGAVAPMSPSNRIYMYASSTATIPTEAYAILPAVSNLQANTHRLKFKGFATIAGRFVIIGYLTDPTDVTSFIQLQEVYLPSTVIANTEEFTVVPTGIPAGVKHLALKNPGYPSSSATMYLDDVVWEAIPSCIEPNTLVSSMITNNTATIGWTEGATATQWKIEYGITGYTQGTGVVVPASTNPFTLTGLMANTTYDFYVSAVCGTSDSSPWTGPSTFKTQCDDVTAFSENFDSYSTGSANPLGNCWSKGGNGSVYLTTGAVAPMSPSNRIYMYASSTATIPTEAYAILPPVSNLQANTHRLKFKGFATTVDRVVQIGYLTDPNDVSTFIQINDVTLPSTAIANTQEFTVIPTGIPTGVKHLALKNPGYPSSNATMYLDDVVWEAIPSCIEPNFLVSSLITNNSATIGWTEGATATQWEIEYGITGYNPGTGNVVPASTNPFTLTGLMSNTSYQFYVRAVCSTSDSSQWTGPSTFKTQCDDVTDFSENFDSYLTGSTNPLADCWGKGGNGSVYLTTGAVAPMSPSNRIYMFASSTATVPTVAYAILPAVSNLQANTHRLKFKGYATAVDRVLQVGYLTDPSNVNTFVQIQDITLPSTVVANTQEFVVVPTGIPAGVKHLALKNPGFTSSSASMYLDDVSWELLPVTAPSCTTNIVSTPDVSCGNFATNITWNASALTDGYKLTIGTTTGGNNVMNNVSVGNVTSYSFSGTANTTYYYKVVPFNTVGEATGCTEQSFTTAVNGCVCTPVYTTGITSNDLISNVVITGTTLSNNSGTVNSGPSYTYFTGQPNYTATLQPGVTYDLVVTVGSFGSQNVAVWIDFNDDLTFSASEKIGFTTTSIAGNGSATIQLPITCSAQAGLHKMRVRDVYSTTGSAIDPCASYSYGETEDYNVTINTLTTPSGSATQSISVSNAADATIEDLVVTPTTVSWYLSQADALSNTNVLPAGTQLVDNTIYYAVNIENGCLTTPLEVTVAVVLGIEDFSDSDFVAYPNPVNDILNLSYSSEIQSVKVLNLLGQELLSKKVLGNSTQIDMSALSAGTYIVNITIDNIMKSIKISKK